jgi:L-arabinokinase
LADIGAGHDTKKDTDDEVREDLAAAGLFNWEVILAFL